MVGSDFTQGSGGDHRKEWCVLWVMWGHQTMVFVDHGTDHWANVKKGVTYFSKEGTSVAEEHERFWNSSSRSLQIKSILPVYKGGEWSVDVPAMCSLLWKWLSKDQTQVV